MANKIEPPLPPQPGAWLGDAPPQVLLLPSFNPPAVMGWVQHLFELDSEGKLLKAELDSTTRQRLQGGALQYDVRVELAVDEQIAAYGAVLFAKPVDLAPRQQRRSEMSALEHVYFNIDQLQSRLRDTILVRKEYQARETQGLVSAIVAAGEAGDSTARATATSITALISKLATDKKLKADRTSGRVDTAVDTAVTELQAQNETLQAEVRHLRSQLEAAIASTPAAPAAVAPATPSNRRSGNR